MASGQGEKAKASGLQRFILLVFGLALVLLFVGFAIAQGIGNPDLSSGAVAVVEDAPGDIGTISEADLKQAIDIAAASAQVEPVPKPGEEKYKELQETALGEIFDSIWIQGQAEEMGISVTPKEVAEEFEKLKSQAFKTEKQYKEFLSESHYTPDDVNQRVKVQVLSTKIQEEITGRESTPSSGEIQDYYEAAKSGQYTQEEKREARALTFKGKGAAEKAKAELEKDDSTASWKKVGAKSDNPVAKKTGGLVNDSAKGEGTAPEPLHAALFAASQGEVEGPLKTTTGFQVYEVMAITPERVISLEEAKAQISTQLAEQAKQATFTGFVRNFSSTWKSRTFCASDFLIERCANFSGDGHSPEANPACYEADPKTPAEICPAVVTQVKPAMPGTVTPLLPEGTKLPQHPRPAGGGESSSETTGVGDLPPVTPPEP